MKDGEMEQAQQMPLRDTPANSEVTHPWTPEQVESFLANPALTLESLVDFISINPQCEERGEALITAITLASSQKRCLFCNVTLTRSNTSFVEVSGGESGVYDVVVCACKNCFEKERNKLETAATFAIKNAGASVRFGTWKGYEYKEAK